jgi:hypothetical protein
MMQRKMSVKCLFCAAAVSFLLVLPTGCTKDKDQQAEEKGTIEKMTDKTAERFEKKIRTPIDKARATRDLGDKRLEDMDKALEKQ